MPPHHFESEVESFLEGSHGDRTHNKQQADHHTVTPLCGTLLDFVPHSRIEDRLLVGEDDCVPPRDDPLARLKLLRRGAPIALRKKN